MKGEAALYSSSSVEWYTPESFMEKVYGTLDDIDLDPACNDGEPNIKAGAYFRQIDDGLSRQWWGRVFLNPPYGDTIGDWARKFAEEYRLGHMSEGIALLPVRTDTAWWHELAAEDLSVCFLKRRLKFKSPHPGASPAEEDFEDPADYLEAETRYTKALALHLKPASATFPSVVVYLGKYWRGFAAEFAEMGKSYREAA